MWGAAPCLQGGWWRKRLRGSGRWWRGFWGFGIDIGEGRGLREGMDRVGG